VVLYLSDDQSDDSGYDAKRGSFSSISVNLDAKRVIFCHDRQYLDCPYLLPNDAEEQARLREQHKHLMNLDHSRLHRALLPRRLQNMLDLGTGTGDWAMEIAEEYPTATVVALDASDIMPHEVPPTCYFYVENSKDQRPGLCGRV
jgi:hypothetical protein